MATKQEIRDREKYINALESKLNALIEDSFDKLQLSDKDNDIVDLVYNFASEVEGIVEEIEMIKENINE